MKSKKQYSESLVDVRNRLAKPSMLKDLSDNDMVVSVSETRLLGAHDFKVLKGIHTTLMAQPAVSSMIDRFFEFGFFETEGLRCPLHSGD